MKKIYSAFFAVLATAVILASPASAEKDEDQKHQEKLAQMRKKYDDLKNKIDRQNDIKWEKARIVNLKFYSAQPDLKAKFNLQCNNQEDYDRVIIGEALRAEHIYWKGGGASKVIMRRTVFVHKVLNPYDVPIPVIDGAGGEVYVRNLCPHGSVTLVKSLEGVVGGQSEQVIWSAQGVYEGKMGFDESSPGYLNRWDIWWEPKKVRPTWVINLARIEKKF